MSATAELTKEGLDPRCKLSRPERIVLNDDVLVRDDIKAAEQGITTKTQNKYDHEGAPFLIVGGVKYRPERAFNAFLLSRIQTRGQPKKPARWRSKSGRK